MKCLLLFQIIGRQVARAPTSIGNTYMLEVGVCVEVCDVDGRPGGTVAPLHPGQLLQLGPPQTLQRLRTKKIPNFISWVNNKKKYQNSRPDSEIIENNVLFKEDANFYFNGQAIIKEKTAIKLEATFLRLPLFWKYMNMTTTINASLTIRKTGITKEDYN